MKTEKSGKILLIVDPSSFIIERLLNMLNDVKIVDEIFTTTNYTEAVNFLKGNDINLVLLDIELSELPKKNGIELLKYIARDFPAIKVVVFSNLINVYYQRLCKKLGAVYFIDKSKDFDKLPEIISSM